MTIEKRIEKLEDVCKPQRHLRPNLVMLYENGEPINEHYAEVLNLNKEAGDRGEDVCLTVLCCPRTDYPNEKKGG